MEVAKVVIQSLEDFKNGKAIIEGKVPTLCEAFTIGILEKGTQGGQTTLMFCLENKDGSVSAAQMTANQFEMLIGCFRGAVERFGA